jgi:hypothetical protein
MTQVLAMLLLCGVASVVVRTLLADRRGDDPRAAAVRAFRTLGPGLFVGAVGLVAFLVFAAASTVIFILAVLEVLTGDANYGAAALAVFIGGTAVLVAGVAGALWWGVKGFRRTAAARPSSSRDRLG